MRDSGLLVKEIRDAGIANADDEKIAAWRKELREGMIMHQSGFYFQLLKDMDAELSAEQTSRKQAKASAASAAADFAKFQQSDIHHAERQEESRKTRQLARCAFAVSLLSLGISAATFFLKACSHSGGNP